MLALPIPVGAVRDRVRGDDFTNFLICCLNDSNEGILGGEEERRGFIVKCGERRLKGKVCEIPVKPAISDGAMEIVECISVDIWCMLDWVIELCHKTAEMHFLGMGCSPSETVLKVTEMECVKIRTHCKAED